MQRVLFIDLGSFRQLLRAIYFLFPVTVLFCFFPPCDLFLFQEVKKPVIRVKGTLFECDEDIIYNACRAFTRAVEDIPK